MKPEGDVSSWQLCLLVLNVRLKTWMWSADLNIPLPDPAPSNRQTCMATELKYGEKMPEGFTGLMPHNPSCIDETCEQLHLVDDKTMMNLNTFEKTSGLDKSLKPVLTSVNIINVNGIDVTLSPETKFSSIQGAWVYRSAIVVLTHTSHILFPIDEPHYKYSMTLGHDRPVTEMGGW